MENDVYFDENNPSVLTKINNLRTTGGNPMLYLDYVAMFNGIFKKAPIRVIGFTKLSNGDVGIVTQQPYVEGVKNVTEQEVSEYMQNIGFKEIVNGDFLNDNVYVQDIHENNAIRTADGDIIVIDNIMEFNSTDAGFGGQHKRGQINNRRNEDVSKVVDENGEPKVVSHSTNNDFTEFINTQENDSGWLGKGFYFFGDRSLDGQYGKNVMEVFLNVREPYYIDEDEYSDLADKDDKEYSEEFSENIANEGYDAVYYNGNLNQEWNVFDPNQIKSAKDNVGTFSRENNDIRFLFGNTNNVSEEQIKEAERLEQEGKTEQEIINQTGLAKSLTNKWKKVIDNDNMKRVMSDSQMLEIAEKNIVKTDNANYVENITKLIKDENLIPFEKVFKFDELFDEYPQLKNKIKVLLYESRTKEELPDGFKSTEVQGRYILGLDVRKFTFGNRMGKKHNMEHSIDTLQDHPFAFIKTEGINATSRHEIQHIIQEEDGEIRGSNPKYFERLLKNKELKLYLSDKTLFDIESFAKESIENGIYPDMDAFYEGFAYDLYQMLVGEIEARSAEINSYEEELSKLEGIIYPIDNTSFLMSTKRMSYASDFNFSPQAEYSIIGEKGAGKVATYYENLQTAKRYEEQGRTPEYIEEKTGWYKVKGEWKMISNEVVRDFKFKKEFVINKKMSLDSVIQDNILFKIYPELKQLKVVLVNEKYNEFPKQFNKEAFFGNDLGTYDGKTKEIYINIGDKGRMAIRNEYIGRGVDQNERFGHFYVRELLKTLAHETQHFIQDVEGRIKGGNTHAIIKDLLNSIGITEDQYLGAVDIEDRVEDLLASFIFSKGWDELSQKQKKDINIIYEHLEALKNNDYKFLVKEYLRILGEVDARIVENIIEKHAKGQNSFSYKEELQEEMDKYGWTEEDLHVPQENPLDFLNDPFTKNFAFLPEIIESRDDIEITRCR